MAIHGLAHVGVFVSDLERSKRFYRDVLGFEITWECLVGDGSDAVRVAFAQSGSCILELVESPAAAGRVDGPVDHIALAVTDIEDMHAALLKKGVQFETDEVIFCDRVFPNGSKWLLFRGPDREHLEFTEVLPYEIKE